MFKRIIAGIAIVGFLALVAIPLFSSSFTRVVIMDQNESGVGVTSNALHVLDTNSATMVGDTTAIQTATELIDDVVFVDDTAVHATGTTKGAGIMAAATPTDGSIAANDIGMLAMSLDRRLHVDTNIAGHDTGNATIIATTLLDDAPTLIASAATACQDYDKLAFFVSYDETEVGNAISAAVTIEVSYDGTNFLAASFYDYAGGATLQTSETISSDGWYYFWFNKDITAPYLKVTITATNTDADDTLSVAGYMAATK